MLGGWEGGVRGAGGGRGASVFLLKVPRGGGLLQEGGGGPGREGVCGELGNWVGGGG